MQSLAEPAPGSSHPVPAQPDEMSLSRFWSSGRLPPDSRTLDGRTIEVIYRGQWSYGFGPDFRNAILVLGNGRPVRGDVEVHVRSSAWAEHGHSENPTYERVILHVVWEADTAIPHPAPVLELRRFVHPRELAELPDPGGLDGSPCSVFRTTASAREAVRIIEAAGDARFEARCAVFEGDLECGPPDQVLYAALMECMGYSENKLGFRLLADAVPFEALAGLDEIRIASVLGAASGLVPERRREAALSPQQWSLARVRPANHPLRRMWGISHVLARSGGDLAGYLAREPLALGLHPTARLLVRAEDSGSLIGADRAVDAACNVVLPFAVALARREGDEELERLGLESWRELPRGAISRVERSMREHLVVPRGSRLLSRARHQQGLLHLHRRFCAQRLCASCPLSRAATHD